MNQTPASDFVKDVKVIKAAILKSRYIAARLANAEMLKLYFAIGAYVSRNSREGRWARARSKRFPVCCRRNCRACAGFLQPT